MELTASTPVINAQINNGHVLCWLLSFVNVYYVNLFTCSENLVDMASCMCVCDTQTVCELQLHTSSTN